MLSPTARSGFLVCIGGYPTASRLVWIMYFGGRESEKLTCKPMYMPYDRQVYTNMYAYNTFHPFNKMCYSMENIKKS